LPLMGKLYDRMIAVLLGERTLKQYSGKAEPEEVHLQMNNSLSAIYLWLFKDASEVLRLQLRLTRKLRPLLRFTINYHGNPLLALSVSVSRKMTADASQEDREHPLFRIATALHGAEALAAHFLDKFNLRKEEVAAIKAIHDVHKQGYAFLLGLGSQD
jgi:hypothetical protein